MSITKLTFFPLLALVSTSVMGENLIRNGGFEEIEFVSNFATGVMNIPKGSSSIPEWTVIGPQGSSVVVVNDLSTVPPLFGNYAVDLNGIQYGPVGVGLTQTIATVAGMNYTLGFDIGNSNMLGYGATSTISAIAGSASQSFTNMGLTGTAGVHSWQHFSLDFTATGSSTDISFLTGQGGGHYVGLDNISVMAAVPEPATYGMLLGGLGMIGIAVRCRKIKVK